MNVFCPHCGSEFALTMLKGGAADVTQQDKQISTTTTQICTSNTAVLRISGSDPDLNSSLIGSGSRSRKFAYSTEFLTFWAVYPKRRNKGDAWRAWCAAKPLLADLLNALSWQCNSAEWLKDGGQYVPYPATYIRARGWEDEPTKIVAPVANGSVPAASQSDYCDWHLTQRNNGKASFKPRDTCPECKHVKALNGTRVSDVYQEDPMVTDIKRRRGLL